MFARAVLRGMDGWKDRPRISPTERVIPRERVKEFSPPPFSKIIPRKQIFLLADFQFALGLLAIPFSRRTCRATTIGAQDSRQREGGPRRSTKLINGGLNRRKSRDRKKGE